MRVLLQRVLNAQVEIEGKIVGSINEGHLLLVGFGKDDTEAVLAPIAKKVLNMRIFTNEKGRFDKSVEDIEGELLAVPQFTLYSDASQRRPGFFDALAPDKATELFDVFVAELKNSGRPVATGIFGAHMKVSLTNDGPVTIMLDSDELGLS